MTDARLRELYELALAARDGGGREGCVSPEAMLALVRREGPEAERLATLDHVMACAACRREFDLLRSIELAGAESDSASVARRPPGRSWRHGAPFAIAAALLVAVGLGVRDRGRSRDDVARDDVTRGAGDGVTLVAPATEIASGAPLVFVWHPDSGASRYLLEVLAADGSVVLSESTSDTTVTPREATRLRPGVSYSWWVRSVGDGGTQRASSVRPLRLLRTR